MKSSEWGEGFAAHKNGVSIEECPYPSTGKPQTLNNLRVAWMEGWYDSEFQDRWPDWLDTENSDDHSISGAGTSCHS